MYWKTDFYDANGFIHDKANADSNNLWIYSAYDFLLTGRLEDNWLNYWGRCQVDDDVYYIYRKPDVPTPPLSRDEAIGMDILGMPIYPMLKENDFYLIKKEVVEEYTYLEAVVDLIRVAWRRRKLEGSEKRNYIWQSKHYAAMKISEKLLPHDRYYFKKNNGDTPTEFEIIMFYIYFISTQLQFNYSARNVMWAQLKELGSEYLIRLMNQKKNFKKYFVANHPFNRG